MPSRSHGLAILEESNHHAMKFLRLTTTFALAALFAILTQNIASAAITDDPKTPATTDTALPSSSSRSVTHQAKAKSTQRKSAKVSKTTRQSSRRSGATKASHKPASHSRRSHSSSSPSKTPPAGSPANATESSHSTSTPTPAPGN